MKTLASHLALKTLGTIWEEEYCKQSDNMKGGDIAVLAKNRFF